MSSFVLVSFDLVNASPTDYDRIREELKKYGLDKYLTGNQGNKVQLPSTTYAGEFLLQPTAQKVKDYLIAAAKSAGVKVGDYFIFISSSGWSWMGGVLS